MKLQRQTQGPLTLPPQSLVSKDKHQQNMDMSAKQAEKELGDEFGARLSINPNLPANTDFAGGQNLDTPNSFKGMTGTTPTTPFGLPGLQFPNQLSTTIPCFGNIANTQTAVAQTNINEAFVATSEHPCQQTNNIIKAFVQGAGGEHAPSQESAVQDLLNFIPKTPLVPGNVAPLKNSGFSFANISTKNSIPTKTEDLMESSNPADQLTVPAGFNQAQTLNGSPAVNENVLANVAASIRQKAVNNKLSSRKTSMRKTNKMKRTRTNGSSANVKDESRWKSWTREEEVFLVGAVMDRFFKRGSLSSTKADDLSSDDSWTVIKNYYETAWKNYYMRTGISIPTERPANALSRHYKVMKARISQNDISGNTNEDFRTYFDEWEKVYNVENCLVSELSKKRSVIGVAPGNSIIAKDKNLTRDFAKRKVRLSVRKESSRSVGTVGDGTESFAIRKEEQLHEDYM